MSQLHASCLQAYTLLNNAITFAEAEGFDDPAHGAFAAAAFPGLPKTRADLVIAAKCLRRDIIELQAALQGVQE